MADPPNPHDTFFKEALSRPAAARDFLRHYLPPGVAEVLDLDSAEVVKDSFVDEDLREHFSDLLYAVHLSGARFARGAGITPVSREDALVYVLFEHKSHPDPHVALQLLRYMVRIWEQLRRQDLPLRPILPLVVYHGQAEWKVSRSFQALVQVPDVLAPFTPEYVYWLCDLSQMRDEDLRGAVLLRVALWVLKSIFRADLRQRLPALQRLLVELARQETGINYLRTVLTYLMKTTERDRISRLDYRALLAGVPGAEGVMPTVADEWIEEGKQQGLERGIVRGHQKAVVQVLAARFESVPADLVEAVSRIQGVSDLVLLLQAAATTRSLAEFAQSLSH